MIIDDVLGAIFSAACWSASLLFWILTRSQRPSTSPILARFAFLKFVGWSALVITKIIWYSSIGWYEQTTIHSITELSVEWPITIFSAIMTFATWRMILDLLRPRTVITTPIDTGQIFIDVNGMITDWNEIATSMFGWTAEEVMGKELALFIIPESMREAHRKGLERYRATGVAPLKDTRYTQLACTKDKGTILVDIQLKELLTVRGTQFMGLISPAKLLV